MLKKQIQNLVKFRGTIELKNIRTDKKIVKIDKVCTFFSMLVTIAEKKRKIYNEITKKNEKNTECLFRMKGRGKMEKTKKFFRKTIVKRVLSFVLAFAMVLTMGAFSQLGGVVAKAEESAIRLYFELPEGTSAGDWAVNAWSNVTITGGAEARIGGTWGDQYKPTLLDNSEGWGYADISGNVEGFQFVKCVADITDTTTNPETYNCWNAQIAKQGYTSAYFEPTAAKWYADTEKTTEIKEAEIQNIFVLAGDTGLTGSNWSLSDTNSFFVQDTKDSNKYSLTYQNVAAGTYAYKVLQDPENKGWDMPWGPDGNNRSVTVEALSDVTFTLDITDTDKGISVTQKAVSQEPEETPAFTDATITMHYKNSGDWDAVYAYISEGSGWNAISGYAYAGAWPGAEVEADAENEGWYSFTITMKVNQFNLIFNNDNGVQTGNIQFTPTAENTEKWVTFTTNQGAPVISDTAPEGWIECTSNAPINPNADSKIKSPVINEDNTITVNLDATGKYADAESVSLMGTLNGTDWSTGLAMEKNESGDLWTVTTPVQTPGVYEYKLKAGENDWFTDPLNDKTTSGGNSKVVIAGLADKAIDAVRGKSVALPETLSFYDEEGNAAKVVVTYSLEDETLADTVTISDGKILVGAASTVEEVVLLAAYETYTSKVTVSVKDKIYTYHIYYYDHAASHMSADAADIWVWENNGGNIGAIPFTSLETLSDGKQWLKADLTTSVTSLGLIPRSKGDWNWQTGNHYFDNTKGAEECNIYIVFGDDANTYTELPEIKELRERYVIVEYDRPAGDYDGWNIYSWNTGMGSSTELYTEEINGKHYITVPIADYDIDFRLEFCMRKTTADSEWAEKDGGDHYIQVPADQMVVKAKFVQGEGVTGLLPYNTGYEMDGANDTIHFYYRDDTLFKTGTLSTLGKVQVVVAGETYEMAYDAENERFCYDYKGLTAGDYEYYYLVNGTVMQDAFNSRVSADGKKSVLTYRKYDVGVKASLSKSTMDYNDNNVLSVSFTGNDASIMKTEEIESICADLSALGLGTLELEAELMKATIACLDTTSTGQKIIPVTVKDIYGNVYKANASVTVAERVKAEGDFDWDEAIIYFAVTDRFFDGSTANNDGVDKNGSLSYHGGDFAGLNQKLDYLKELGVNTIWITPIVENSDTTTEKDGQIIESTGYHGYWASDFTKLNSHLGTAEEFRALLTAAHERDMKIMVDVVINHAGYETEEYFNGLLDGVAMIRDASNTVSGSDVYASLAGLPDFVTEDSRVREQIIEWQTNWMDEYDIDYYRIDTVKHVDYTTWAAFKNSLTEVNPDFKIIGEYAGAGYANTAGELGTGTMDALLDFDFNDFAQNFVGGSLSEVEAKLQKRNTSLNNTATMGSFISSHDEDGLQYKLVNESGFSAEEAENLMKVAATLQITAKGQPIIYYGEEIGQTGADNYPYQTNRYDFDWTAQAAQEKDGSSMYNHYKTLLEIRNEYTEVFAKGSRSSVAVSDTEGYDVIARSYEGTTLYVGMNIKALAKEVTISVNEAAGSLFTNLYDGKEYTVAADQTVTISIPAAKDGGTVVLAAKEEGVQEPDDSETEDSEEPDNSETEGSEEPSNSETEGSEEPDNSESENSEEPDDSETENGEADKEEETVTITGIVSTSDIIEEIIKVGDKLIRKLISAAGYVIEGDADVLPEGATFEVSIPGTGSDIYKKAFEAMKQIAKSKGFKVIEITLYDASKAEVHELSDYVSVSLPVPAGLSTAAGNQLVVYRLTEDGTLVKCKTTVNNGVLTFETNHFSTFIISEEAVSAVNTSDNTARAVSAGFMILFAGAAVLGAVYRKRIVK